MEMTMSAPLSFTKGAIEELTRLQQSTAPQNFLRLGVKGGGCSGLSYILGFDEKKENDDLYEYEGLSFIMDRSHGIYLAGMQIDWQDGLNSRGFVFKNPNASK